MGNTESALLFRAEHDAWGPGAHIRADAVNWNGSEICTPPFAAYDKSTHLTDFRITGQISPGEQGYYGWRHAFADPHHVNLERAEVLTPILRRVTRGLEKYDQERGYPTTFCDYVTRIAALLKVRHLILSPKAGQRIFASTGQRWRKVDGSGLQLWVRDHEQTYTAEREKAA